MNCLYRWGLTEQTSKSEFLSTLSRLSNDSLLSLRASVFEACASLDLAPSNIPLVTRRGTAANPITSKHAGDIWTLTDCLRHKKSVPRVLLRNGKRDKTTHLNSQSSSSHATSMLSSTITADLTSEVSQPSTADLVGTLPPPSTVAISMIMKEINIIKNDLHSLKTSVSSLQDLYPSDFALRDEVALLRKSLNITRPPHLVSTSCSPTSNGTSASDTRPTSLRGLRITAWNCRGVSSAVPYLQVLAETSDIISISDNWLWPFELHTLDKILPGYSAHGCSDKRLSESSTLVRGYIWGSGSPLEVFPPGLSCHCC